MKTLLLAALAGAAVLVSTAAASAQASLADQLSTVRKMQAERKARRGPAQMQREILQALLFRELTVDFRDTPAREAFDFLKTALGINIIVRYSDDPIAHGIDPDTLITLEVEKMPALDVLTLVLDQCAVTEECAWQLRSSFLEIGTKDRLSVGAAKVTKVYNIDTLLFEPVRFDDAEHRSIVPGYPFGAEYGVGLGPGSGGLGFSSGFAGASDLHRYDPNSPEEKTQRAEDIIDLITSTVEPLAWMRNGGTGATIRYRDGALIVRAPDFIQRQIGGYPAVPPPAKRPEGEPTAPK